MADPTSAALATRIQRDLIEGPVTTPAVLATAAPSIHETKTSIIVFRRYLVRSQSSSGEAIVDASRINSKACYDEWQVPNPTPH